MYHLEQSNENRGLREIDSNNHGRHSISTGRTAIIIAICIIGASYGLFFFLQGVIEASVRANIFDQNKEIQEQSTKAISQQIESDLDSLSTKLGLVAEKSIYRSGDLSSQEARTELNSSFYAINKTQNESEESLQINSESGNRSTEHGIGIDGLYLVDREGTVTIDTRSPLQSSTQGMNLSERSYVRDTAAMLRPVFSKGYIGSDGVYRIAATYPIFAGTDKKAESYLGMVVAVMATKEFFQHYGNIYDIKSQYIAVLDEDSVQLVHPVQSLVGARFFGDYAQNLTGHNEALNNLIHKVMSGNPDSAIYQFVNGQRLTTGYPIYFDGKPTYFVFIITPTSTIYSSIDALLFAQKVETFALIVGTTSAIGILIFMLARWNKSLDRVVRSRTIEIARSNEQLQRVNARLEESNKQISFANERLMALNEQLINSESLQKEFVNVAAHELRTPIQPIVGLTDAIKAKTSDPEMLELVDVLGRSARRLQQISSNILDVARIESQTLRLRKSEVDMNQLISLSIDESKSQFRDNQDLMLSFDPANTVEKGAIVLADKDRIYQVVSNLIANAIKFTQKGNIVVSTNIKDNQFVVKITDNGSGIHPEILPKLFSKFVTGSDKGTGLGLFISKSIVEAHGGKIWAENNKGTKGATFTFTLPMSVTSNTGHRDINSELSRKNQ